MPAAAGRPALERGTEVTFSWQDYRDHQRGGATFLGGARRPTRAGLTYRLQVSQSATITDGNAIDDVTVDQTTYTAPPNLSRRATSGGGSRPSTRTATGSPGRTPQVHQGDPGQTSTPRPTGPSTPTAPFPAFGSHVSSGEFPFRWTADDFDVTWKLEVYKNDDTTLSTANRVLIDHVEAGRLRPRPSLPPSSQPYRWRILRYDVTGAEARGRWSDLGRFYVDPSARVLTGPATGATSSSRTVRARLGCLPRGDTQATRYAVEIRNVGRHRVSRRLVDSATPGRRPDFPTGTYSWIGHRVRRQQQRDGHQPLADVLRRGFGGRPRRSPSIHTPGGPWSAAR